MKPSRLHPRTRVAGACALGLASLLFARPALADPKDEAKRHFMAGLEWVRQGDYDQGVGEFLIAYQLSPHPVVLYNVARALADAGRYEESIGYFDRYLASDPDDRVEVEGILQTLRTRVEQERAEALAAEAAAATAPPASAPRPEGCPEGGQATDAEVAELQRVAEDLASLATRLQARGLAPVEPAVVEGPAAQAAPGPEIGPTPPQGAAAPLDLGEQHLVEDLYDRVVVTAARYGQDPLQSPSAITVITAEQIRMTPAASVADLLRTVPGLDAMQLAAGQTDIAIRGFNRRFANKVLVLIDGRSVYLDFIGSPLWNTLPITLEEIDRIEVIRGAGSAMYGANAFSGVVNIITKAPGGHDTPNQATAALGSTAYGRGSLLVSGRKGSVAWRASMGLNRMGRWARAYDPAARPDYASDAPDQDLAVDNHTVNAQLDWRLPREGFASLSAGLNDGLDEFFALGTTGDYYSDQHGTYLRGDAGLGPLRLRTFWNHLETMSGPWYYQAGTASWGADVLMDIVDVDLAGDWALGKQKHHRITASAGYRFKDIDWNYLDSPHTEHHLNAFLQDESKLGPVVATGSIRVDEHPLVGVMPSPRLAVVTNLGQGRALRLNGGTAFRTPTFMESYTSMQQRLSTDAIIVTSVGDTELAPERMLAFEAGYLEHSSDWWRGELSAYYYRVSDLIELGSVVITPDHLHFDDEVGGWKLGETYFENLPAVYHAMGGEVAVDLFRFEGLDLCASYAFEYIQAVENGEASRSESTPMHKLNGGVIYRSPWRIDASMNAAWVDKQVWGIRSFDATGQIQVDDEPLDGWVLLTNRVVVHSLRDQRLDLVLDAWNWLALIPSVGAHREYPMGQPVGARLTAGLSTRF